MRIKELKSLKYNSRGVLKIELDEFNLFVLYFRLTLGPFICVKSTCTCNVR